MVGLHLIDVCRGQDKQFFDVCFAFGISPPYQSRNLQDYTTIGLRDYVLPFLLYVEKALIKAAETYSVCSIAEGRFSNLHTGEISKLLPKTSRNLQRIAVEFLRPEGEVLWQNVGNSCRQTMIEFTKEVSAACGIEPPTELKDGDVKGILKHLLGKTSSGRFKDTLESLSESIWNHTQSLLHRPTANKQEATRIFLWTGMLVSEFAELARAYNEG